MKEKQISASEKTKARGESERGVKNVKQNDANGQDPQNNIL